LGNIKMFILNDVMKAALCINNRVMLLDLRI